MRALPEGVTSGGNAGGDKDEEQRPEDGQHNLERR
jgi:hypothetical protein